MIYSLVIATPSKSVSLVFGLKLNPSSLQMFSKIIGTTNIIAPLRRIRLNARGNLLLKQHLRSIKSQIRSWWC